MRIARDESKRALLLHRLLSFAQSQPLLEALLGLWWQVRVADEHPLRVGRAIADFDVTGHRTDIRSRRRWLSRR